MKKINDEKHSEEYKDVHGNVYYTREEVLPMDQHINLLVMMNKTPTYYPIERTIDNIELPSCFDVQPTLWPTKYCGKDIQAEGVDFTLDNLTHRCDLISFSPYVPQHGNNLSSPIDINGIPVKLPKGAKIHVNTVPTIENGEITSINSYPCIELPNSFINFINGQLDSEKTKGWGNSEEGSIEKILYDIGKKTTGALCHQFSIDNGRIIHSYLNYKQKDPLCIEMYELKTGENNKFRAEFKSSTKVPGEFLYNHNIAVIGSNIYIYDMDDTKPRVRVYNEQLQLTYKDDITDCHSMQDFLNRTALKTNCRRLPDSDYAKMEKAYIERKEKDANDIGKNNTSSDMSLKNKEQGVGNGKGGAK